MMSIKITTEPVIETAYSVSTNSYPIDTIRKDFPILSTELRGRKLVYLDNAATTQKPRQVIEALTAYYEKENANIHRGVHYLSEQATLKYEQARHKVKEFIKAGVNCEIIFTKGATESINLVAQSYGRAFIRPGDEILISTLEHHSNIVPWQMLCQEKGAVLRVIPMLDSGDLDMEAFDRLLTAKTKIVAVTQLSNVTGTLVPVREMCRKARDLGAVTLVDGAQSTPHLPIDVQEMGADFFVFSAHKLYGPTGVGVLYGRAELLEAMPPWLGGGNMIRSVSFEKTTYADLPDKFEAGTPDIGGVIGLGAAIDYLQDIGLERISQYEEMLTDYACARLELVEGLQIQGSPRARRGVISFTLDCVHPHDIGQLLDQDGIAIRAGHHCAQPLMQRLGVPATARLSLGLYNTAEEIDYVALRLQHSRKLFLS
ncbi:MAG: cysteine desulfurase [Candidatus Hydrogenedens sp.]|jgi:cysteine desulfurase/selenocysteine lyase|nr:cysteine desulfurase [Candidatus Hydrogenedens sp.]